MNAPTRSSRGAMHARIVETEAELSALQAPWTALLRENPPLDLPIYAWEWFLHRWRCFGIPANQRLCVVAIEERGKLCGVLPLVRGSERIKGVTIKTLGFCNPGISPRETLLLAADEDATRVGRAACERLLQERHQWDLLRLVNVPETSAFHTFLLQNGAALPLAWIQTKGSVSPCVQIEGTTYEEYFARNGNKESRRRHKRAMERCAAAGQRLEMKVFGHANDVSQGLDLALAVRKNSWKGPFANPKYERFYREVSAALGSRGEVVIPVLLVDQTPIAAQFITGRNGSYFLHTNDFDMRYRDWGAGGVLLYLVILRAFEQGWRVFDFTGDAYTYKRESANGVTAHSRFEMFHSAWKSRALYLAKTSWLPVLRRALRRPDAGDFLSKRDLCRRS